MNQNPLSQSADNSVPIDKDHVGYVSIMCSPSHTYGNALAYIQNWIINLFDDNYFKTIHIFSKLAHRQLRSTGEEYFKKETPVLVLKPRIDTNEDRFLGNTPLMERQTDIYSTYGYTAYQPFFKDSKKGINILYQMNRSVMYVDVTIIVSTMMQQIDLESYIRNATRVGHPFFLDTYLESYLPLDMLKIVSELSGIPLEDEDGNTKDFVSYMNGNSIYPITYKLDGAKGTKEFYRYYPTRIDVLLNDLSMSDGSRTNQISSSYPINFTIRMEYNSAGMYFLFSKRLKTVRKMMAEHTVGDAIVPLYTDVLYAEDYDTQPGWIFFKRFSIILGELNEHVSIKSILNQSIQYAIDYHLKNGLPMLDLIDIRIRKQGRTIYHGKDYTIDYKNIEIVFNNDDFGYYTYTVLIYINLEYINNLIKQIFKMT